jgi:urocanate hydratase
MPDFVPGIRTGASRGFNLTRSLTETLLKNALRYLPDELHAKLAPEIYAGSCWFTDVSMRIAIALQAVVFRPSYIDYYNGNCVEGRAFQVMIDKLYLILKSRIYPYESGHVRRNRAGLSDLAAISVDQTLLEIMTREQTLVVESGHPLGFVSHPPNRKLPG